MTVIWFEAVPTWETVSTPGTQSKVALAEIRNTGCRVRGQSLTCVVVHHVCDTQHVPVGPQLLHQGGHVGPGVALPLGTELWVKGELVGQGVTGPGLSQSLQRREVDHVVPWDGNGRTEALSDDITVFDNSGGWHSRPHRALKVQSAEFGLIDDFYIAGR